MPVKFSSDAESDGSIDGTTDCFVGKNGTKWTAQPCQSRNISDEYDDGNHGLTTHSAKIETAKDAFLQFFNNSIFAVMTKYTNLQAQRKTSKGKRKTARWKKVTETEMQAFVGIIVAAGRLHQNDLDLQSLWENDDFWCPSIYKTAMSRKRFKSIMNFWRFDDKSTRKRRFAKSNNKLEAIDKIYKEFVANCINNHDPGKNLTVDERLCVFRGK